MGGDGHGFQVHRAKPTLFQKLRTVLITGGVAVAAIVVGSIAISDDRLVGVVKERGAPAPFAVWALGFRGCPPAARPVLKETLDPGRGPRDDARLRSWSAWALGCAKSREVVEVLDEAARSDPLLPVRVAAVRALGKNGDPAALRALQRALSDPEAVVRENACRASEDLKDRQLVPDLMDRLHEPSFDIRNAAAHALKAITGADCGTNERQWREYWAAHGHN